LVPLASSLLKRLVIGTQVWAKAPAVNLLHLEKARELQLGAFP
jgi:hypothetical protein